MKISELPKWVNGPQTSVLPIRQLASFQASFSQALLGTRRRTGDAAAPLWRILVTWHLSCPQDIATRRRQNAIIGDHCSGSIRFLTSISNIEVLRRYLFTPTRVVGYSWRPQRKCSAVTVQTRNFFRTTSPCDHPAHQIWISIRCLICPYYLLFARFSTVALFLGNLVSYVQLDRSPASAR